MKYMYCVVFNNPVPQIRGGFKWERCTAPPPFWDFFFKFYPKWASDFLPIHISAPTLNNPVYARAWNSISNCGYNILMLISVLIFCFNIDTMYFTINLQVQGLFVLLINCYFIKPMKKNVSKVFFFNICYKLFIWKHGHFV